MKSMFITTIAVRAACAAALIWMALQWRDALQSTVNHRIDRIEAAIEAATNPAAPAAEGGQK